MRKRLTAFLGAGFLAMAAGQSAHAQSYSNAVVALAPVAYWPLTESVAPPFGAYIATNLGTTGVGGNGYYETWFQPWNTGTNVLYYQTNNIQHVAGAIGDSDLALNCTRSAAGAGGYVVFPRATNGVQNTAINILPPFSIEFWAKPSSTTSAVMPLINEGRVPEQQGAEFGYTTNETGFCIGQYGGNFFFSTWNATGSDGTKQEIDTALTANAWQHMVITFDGTNQTWFKNGAQVKTRKISTSIANKLGQLYTPNMTAPLLIGTGSLIGGGNGGSEFAGAIDDVAIYTNLLDPTAIQNHYNAATATDNTYQNTVLADNPTIYVRLGEPAYPVSNYPNPSTYPVAANAGVIGAAGNGYYQPGTTPGVAGPPFSGFGANSRAVAINGHSGAVDVGAGNLPAELNPTGQSPMTVAGWFQANPADAPSRFQILAGHGNSSWRIALDAWADGNRFNPGNGPELQFTNIQDVVTNGFMVNDGNWHFVAGVSDGTNDYLYIDGLLAKSGSGVGNIVGTNGDVLLGADPANLVPSYNSPTVRTFDGQIAHIAFFTNALSGAQIQQLYTVAGVSPFFVQAPQSTTNNAGANVTIGSAVHGSSPIIYQWYKDGSAVSGQTNASLVFTPSATSDAGNYTLVATNSSGALTSSVVTLFLYGAPNIVQQSLPDIRVFAGASPVLQIAATGAQPIQYQWSVGGTPIPGATNSSYTITNIQTGGTYTCSVANFVGPASPGFNPVTVTVLADPAAPYPQAVLSSGPIAYYRLNENPDDGAGNNGVTAFDNAGGYNGVYSNTVLAQSGYNVYSDPGNYAPFFGLIPLQGPNNDMVGNVPQLLNFSTPNGSNAEFSIEAWINNVSGNNANCIVGLGYGNGGEQFVLDTGSGSQGDLRFFVRNAAGTTASASAGFSPADSQWHHVVAVCDESNGVVRLYWDGNQVASGTIATKSGILNSSMPMTIGARESGNSNPVNYDNQFLGLIDEVAIYNRPLSPAEIQSHYYASGIAPVITTVTPQTLSTNKNSTVSFVATTLGTAPLNYQWYDPSSTPIPNQTNATLTLANVQVAQSGTYSLTVNNLYGSATTNVSLTVNEGAAVIATDLTPTDLTVYTGSQVTYSIVASGTPPFEYQWYQNGLAIPNATNAGYSFAALLGTNTYYVSVTNDSSAGTPAVSSIATVVGMPITTLNPANFTDKVKITFSGYNRSETLKDFPVLVKLGAGVSGFNYGHFASASGGDLRFTDSTGTRVIPSEIDEWNSSGISTVWVQVPALSGPSDYIWAYWGNPADTNLPASTNVWVPAAFENVPAYERVYHLKEGAFPFVDSTLQHNSTNGIAPGQTNGIVGTGASFGHVNWLDAGTNDMGDTFTLSAWVNIPTGTSDEQCIWANFVGGYGQPGFSYYVNTYQASDQALVFASGDGGPLPGGGNEMKTPANTVPFAGWHMVSAAINRTNGVGQFYVDGNFVYTTNTIVKDFPKVNDLALGAFVGGGYGTFTGGLDEARIRSSVDSSNWVWASWATVAQNSTMESYSAVDSTVAGSATPVSIQFSTSAGNLILTGAGGSGDASLQYHIMSSTNLSLPLSQWTPVVTNSFDGSGNFSNAIPIDGSKKSQFFEVVIP